MGKFFGKVKNGQKKCPKSESENTLCENISFVTIQKNYGVSVKKYFLICYVKIFYYLFVKRFKLFSCQ